MRDDPFARLSGLDQQLFAQRSPFPAVATIPAPDQAPPNDGTAQRPSGQTVAPSSTPSSATTSRRANGGMAARAAHSPADRRVERTHGGTAVRKIDRRSYDFYHDQVLWLNRMKVELEERYDLQVTANAMVQLALDLLILDYRRRGWHSHLMTRLVFGQPLEDETAERPDGATAGGAEGGE